MIAPSFFPHPQQFRVDSARHLQANPQIIEPQTPTTCLFLTELRHVPCWYKLLLLLMLLMMMMKMMLLLLTTTTTMMMPLLLHPGSLGSDLLTSRPKPSPHTLHPKPQQQSNRALVAAWARSA